MRFYQRVLRYTVFLIALGSLTEFIHASSRICTDLPGIFAYRHAQEYYYQITPHDFPVIDEDPTPASCYMHNGSFARGAPVTVYNNWPERVANASIFPYLARHHSVNPGRYGEFCDFVDDWYQSSCAVVYSSSKGSEIVGSGSIIDGHLVSTARHNFEHIPIHHLFARFFHYTVFHTEYEGVLWVKEEFLDVPVINTYRAINGLDAGCLAIPLIDPAIFGRYARVLPSKTSAPEGSLAFGEYGMFHFAGGRHQVSVGEVKQCMRGAWLHNDIGIQGGPGSSGAAIIGKWFDNIQGCGVSIYRKLDHNGGTSVERRLISFTHFANIGATLDSISAPYYHNSDFYVSPTSPLSESGYEFLRWNLAYAGDGNDHPGLKIFKHSEPNHSNHHIIPRGDLLYLWHYVNGFTTSYQPVIDRLRNSAEKQVTLELLNAPKVLKKAAFADHRKKVDALCEEQLAIYERLRQCISSLHVSYYDSHGRLKVIAEEIGFYWAGWNLFKGWDQRHRSDDPLRDGDDRSEKTKPVGFNKGLWNCLKDPKVGLYRKIQELKQSSLKGVPTKELLLQIEASLNLIRDLLDEKPDLSLPHPYNKDEWAKQNGLFRVKA